MKEHTNRRFPVKTAAFAAAAAVTIAGAKAAEVVAHDLNPTNVPPKTVTVEYVPSPATDIYVQVLGGAALHGELPPLGDGPLVLRQQPDATIDMPTVEPRH